MWTAKIRQRQNRKTITCRSYFMCHVVYVVIVCFFIFIFFNVLFLIFTLNFTFQRLTIVVLAIARCQLPFHNSNDRLTLIWRWTFLLCVSVCVCIHTKIHHTNINGNVTKIKRLLHNQFDLEPRFFCAFIIIMHKTTTTHYISGAGFFSFIYLFNNCIYKCCIYTAKRIDFRSMDIFFGNRTIFEYLLA